MTNYKPVPVPPELLESVAEKLQSREEIAAEFMRATSPAMLLTNGGELFRLYQERRPPHVFRILYDADKKTRDKLKAYAVERLEHPKPYGVRLFVEGYKLPDELTELLNNAGVEMIEL